MIWCVGFLCLRHRRLGSESFHRLGLKRYAPLAQSGMVLNSCKKESALQIQAALNQQISRPYLMNLTAF